MFADAATYGSSPNARSSAEAIRNYLADLERALQGADPALIHDALIDTETHLRLALAAGKSATAAIEAFGTPNDIALAYLYDQSSIKPARTVATTTGAAPATSGEFIAAAALQMAAPEESGWKLRNIPIVGIYFDPYAWGSVAFLTVGFIFALIAFVWVVVLGTLSISLIPTLIGIPLLIALLGSARAISLFIGQVIEALVGVRMPRRAYRVDLTGVNGLWQRIWLWIKDIRSWLTVVFLVGNFPVALFFFCLLVALFSASISMIVVGAFELAGLGSMVRIESDSTINILGTTYTPDETGQVHIPPHILILSSLVGMVLLTVTMWLSKGVALIYAQVVRAIQVVRPQSLAQH
ncbi:MAG: sensor domain-containing protein [Planctomycetes bacterium]|nr:sensor domain-containing protein [Planctomycetota bacterium]